MNLSDQMVTALQAHMASGNPRIPEAGRVLWQAFVALSRSRSYGGMGPNPISFGEMEAWCRLMRMPLEPHHVEIICALDQAWLRSEPPPKPRGGLTPGAFDAVVG